MRAIDADAIVVHKFPSEDYDPSENDAEKAYRKGWNDALDAVAEFQPSAEPKESLDKIVTRHEDIGYDKGFRDGYAQAITDAEPVRMKGRWIPTHENTFLSHPDSITYVCSECGYKIYTVYGFPSKTNYCPSCGACMSEGEEDEDIPEGTL